MSLVSQSLTILKGNKSHCGVKCWKPDNSILNSTGKTKVCTDTKSISLNLSEVCENDAGRLEYFILIESACSQSNSLSFSTPNHMVDAENELIGKNCKYIQLNSIHVQ